MDSETEHFVTKERSPILHEWTISEKALRNLYFTSLKSPKELCSNFFTVPSRDELTYGFHFSFIGGEENGNPRKAVIKFELQNLWEKYESNLTFSIESANFSVECKATHSGPWNNASRVAICRAEKLFDPKKRFIIDGKLVIKCEGFIFHDEIHPNLEEIDDSDLHPVQESKDLWECSNEKKCSVDVNGKMVYLHEEIFNHMFPESFRSNPKIYDFIYESVELAIKFNYDFRLVYPLTLEESLEIFKFMNIYGRKGIMCEFESFLIEQVTESTVCQIAKCADECKDPKILEYCTGYLIDCLKHSTPIADFDLLPTKIALELFDLSFRKRVYVS